MSEKQVFVIDDDPDLKKQLESIGVTAKKVSKVIEEPVSQKKSAFSKIIAGSAVMRSVFETVKQLAPYSTTVLLTGESGTGKELLARAIHDSSPRSDKPFVAINCGAIPENLIESELFGHKKGSFTDASRDKKGLFEEANFGTLFLDEIGELSLHLQVKLLRALQDQKIRRVGDEELISLDVRVISATLKDLQAAVLEGSFRDDLFYRLNVVGLHIPPLRERPEDISLLIEHFITKHSKKLGINKKSISAELTNKLIKYPWRGNVRELENAIERMMVLSGAEELQTETLPEAISSYLAEKPEAKNTPLAKERDLTTLSIKAHSRDLEIDLITRALKKTNGNRTHTAKLLEISHRALLYKIKEFGL